MSEWRSRPDELATISGISSEDEQRPIVQAANAVAELWRGVQRPDDDDNVMTPEHPALTVIEDGAHRSRRRMYTWGAIAVAMVAAVPVIGALRTSNEERAQELLVRGMDPKAFCDEQ